MADNNHTTHDNWPLYHQPHPLPSHTIALALHFLSLTLCPPLSLTLFHMCLPPSLPLTLSLPISSLSLTLSHSYLLRRCLIHCEEVNGAALPLIKEQLVAHACDHNVPAVDRLGGTHDGGEDGVRHKHTRSIF